MGFIVVTVDEVGIDAIRHGYDLVTTDHAKGRALDVLERSRVDALALALGLKLDPSFGQISIG